MERLACPRLNPSYAISVVALESQIMVPPMSYALELRHVRAAYPSENAQRRKPAPLTPKGAAPRCHPRPIAEVVCYSSAPTSRKNISAPPAGRCGGGAGGDGSIGGGNPSTPTTPWCPPGDACDSATNTQNAQCADAQAKVASLKQQLHALNPKQLLKTNLKELGWGASIGCAVGALGAEIDSAGIGQPLAVGACAHEAIAGAMTAEGVFVLSNLGELAESFSTATQITFAEKDAKVACQQ